MAKKTEEQEKAAPAAHELAAQIKAKAPARQATASDDVVRLKALTRIGSINPGEVFGEYKERAERLIKQRRAVKV